MDSLLGHFDDHVGDRAYGAFAASLKHLSGQGTGNLLPRHDPVRQYISLTFVLSAGTALLYTIFSTLSFFLIFDRQIMKHPHFKRNQVAREIEQSFAGFVPAAAMMAPFLIGEVQGYSQLYASLDEGPFSTRWLQVAYAGFSVALLLVFTEVLQYALHRWMHLPAVYKWLHKPHHRWIVPTPFAAFAFHPLESAIGSTPYHLAAYLWPMHVGVYLTMFVAVFFYVIVLHDSSLFASPLFIDFLNGPGHHTLHHANYTVNFGQYTVYMDKLFGSYRQPALEGGVPAQAKGMVQMVQ